MVNAFAFAPDRRAARQYLCFLSRTPTPPSLSSAIFYAGFFKHSSDDVHSAGAKLVACLKTALVWVETFAARIIKFGFSLGGR
jgi:hypothetical protein